MNEFEQYDNRPLAARMRPQLLTDYIGQAHLLKPGKPLYQALQSKHLYSMILWGAPGTGKTTLAQLAANIVEARWETLSAVLAGVKEIRQSIELAKEVWIKKQQRTVLFIDEIHRFNKAQQDAFLPHVEEGTVIFIGATTENPSFALNNALLSRTRVFKLQRLTETEIIQVIDNALTKPEGYGGKNLIIPVTYKETLALAADGDARRALNMLEALVDFAVIDEAGQLTITEQALTEICTERVRYFDKAGDLFYDQISALHKAVRGSSPDAALYWLVRMLDGGCDPLYIARRMIRMANEDIGNADPRALTLTMQAWEAVERLGVPEGELALAQAIIYLACAAKSNAVYVAYKKAQTDVKNYGSLEVPLHLRNAPTKLMRDLGYGKAYRYAHDEPEGYAAGENYFPETMPTDTRYYYPVERGLEKQIIEKLAYLRQLDKQAKE